MIQQLTPLGVDVPGGFGVTSDAYDAVLDRFQLRERLQLLLRDVDGTCAYMQSIRGNSLQTEVQTCTGVVRAHRNFAAPSSF